VIRGENLLVEAYFRSEAGLTDAGLLGKFDGKSGYRLTINPAGQAEFAIAADGRADKVASKQSVNDGKWHHVLAEVDRETGRMTIYVDGQESASGKASLSPGASLDNPSDFLVGKTHDGKFFRGTVDFMRVCKGTLEDAKTDIDELYAWQTDGPFLYDMAGNAPAGERRDAGALEYLGN
jgi:hypothetical protein